MNATARAAFLLTSLLVATLVSSGCVYRPNIQQGNLLEVEDVDKVESGMTRSQVRYLLGTPMVADPFNPQRWDYLYTFRRGRESKVERSHFVIHFDGDRVSRVEKLDLPDRPPRRRGGDVPAAEPAREPGEFPAGDDAAPTAPQPQPPSAEPPSAEPASG